MTNDRVINDSQYQIAADDIEVLTECPVCLSADLLLLSDVQKNELKFLATSYCNCCGFVFRSTRPGLQWFEKSWALREIAAPASPDSELETLRRIRYANLARCLSELVPGRSLLDVGTGTGTGLVEFKKQGWGVVGIEPDSGRAKIAESLGIRIVKTAAVDDGQYDAVTIIHVLEHFHDPKTFLRQAVKNLKPDAYLYIEVPNIRTFVNWQDSLYLEHMNNFTDKNLVLLLSQLGFEAQYRFFPKTKAFGVTHLGILFKKNPGMSPKQPEKDLTVEGVKTLYSRGLFGAVNFPLHFKVDQINDICMTLSELPYPVKTAGELHLAPRGRLGKYQKKLMQLFSLSISGLVCKLLARFNLDDRRFLNLTFEKIG